MAASGGQIYGIRRRCGFTVARRNIVKGQGEFRFCVGVGVRGCGQRPDPHRGHCARDCARARRMLAPALWPPRPRCHPGRWAVRARRRAPDLRPDMAGRRWDTAPLDRYAFEAEGVDRARSLYQVRRFACLDAVANAEVDLACEGGAVWHRRSRWRLLCLRRCPDIAACRRRRFGWPTRDATFRPAFERARRGLEADPYGLVAHVLKTRGCEPAGCAELKLLRDAAPIVTNMKAQSFDSHVTAHASA